MVVADKNAVALALNVDYLASNGIPWKFSVSQHLRQSLVSAHSYRNVNSSIRKKKSNKHKKNFNFISHLKSFWCLNNDIAICRCSMLLLLLFLLWRLLLAMALTGFDDDEDDIVDCSECSECKVVLS